MSLSSTQILRADLGLLQELVQLVQLDGWRWRGVGGFDKNVGFAVAVP